MFFGLVRWCSVNEAARVRMFGVLRGLVIEPTCLFLCWVMVYYKSYLINCCAEVLSQVHVNYLWLKKSCCKMLPVCTNRMSELQNDRAYKSLPKITHRLEVQRPAGMSASMVDFDEESTYIRGGRT